MRILYIPFCMLLLLMASCTPGNLSFSEAMERNNDKFETEEEREDAAFLVEAADYNLLMTKLSDIAANQAYSRVVTDFGAKSLSDHQQIEAKLRQLSKEKKVALGAEIGERHLDMLEDVKQADKRNIDRIYLNTIEIIQERVLRMYEEAALNANDAEVRAFAASQLEIFRNHNRRAQEIRDELI
ncbi:DUF4142 domain-containing protein [Nafulsella turpanensis]|uniref:DUF4142 domain-containing protein n=1 Tax=Nafulsella turpanensis TaxID=1265690 RepID=UPI00037B75AB|nr:DUF4142 domain-containing protein [Nafulsella turpanensis]